MIVTAGAIGSPKLLMLSGIGPAGHLGEVGIRTSTISRASARISRTTWRSTSSGELNGPYSYDKYKKRHWKLWAGIEYNLFGRAR